MSKYPAGERLQALVPRDSREETTFALVRCTKNPQVSDAGGLQRRVTDAVTLWVRQTEAGRDAFFRSCGDYNVGDLSSDLDDADLLHLLAAYSVQDLTIEVFSFLDVPGGWTYDAHLVDARLLGTPKDDAPPHEVPEIPRRSPDVERRSAQDAGP